MAYRPTLINEVWMMYHWSKLSEIILPLP